MKMLKIKKKDKNNTIKAKKVDRLKNLKFKLKYRKLKLTDDEYKTASEYLTNDVDILTMEKDLLLRGLKYKEFDRIKDAYMQLMEDSGFSTSLIIEKQKLKGGILDGIRRSKQDS